MSGVLNFLFRSQTAAASMAHKAVWTAVQSGISVLLADGLLDIVDLGLLQTAAVAGLAGALTVLKEQARKQLSDSEG